MPLDTAKAAPVEAETSDDEDDEEEEPRAHDAEVEDKPRSKDQVNDDEDEDNDDNDKAARKKPNAGRGSEKPPEPAKGPRADPKTGTYECGVCGRKVGGGLQGNFSHRRSPYHLASWIYYSRCHAEEKPWHHCMSDAKRWSETLWDQNSTGPAELPAKVKVPEGSSRQKSQKPSRSLPRAVDRADPERKRRDKGDGNDPDAGSAGGASSSSSSNLLQMWQATVRELR